MCVAGTMYKVTKCLVTYLTNGLKGRPSTLRPRLRSLEVFRLAGFESLKCPTGFVRRHQKELVFFEVDDGNFVRQGNDGAQSDTESQNRRDETRGTEIDKNKKTGKQESNPVTGWGIVPHKKSTSSWTE